jgi:hypothetical protein
MTRWPIWILMLLSLAMPAMAQEHISLMYTGNTDGLASTYSYRMGLPYQLATEYARRTQGVSDFRIANTSTYFHYQQTWIGGPRLGIQELRTLLHNPDSLAQPLSRQQIQVLDADDTLSFEPLQQASDLVTQLAPLAESKRNLRNRIRLQAATLSLYPNGLWKLELAPPTTPLPTDPYRWELILGMTLRFKVEGQNTPASLLMLGKPAGEGARRVQLMRELRGPEQLLVDGGNILEGLSSVATGQLSRQRENSLQAIQNLGYDAIAVGKNELRGGLAQLQQEQQQWGLPLLSANLLQAGKPLFKPWKLMRLGQKSLLLIGLTDGEDVQSLQEQGILPSDLSLEQPSKAVADALTDAYLQLGRNPDVVVVLTNIDGDGLRELEYLQDVQLVLGNSTGPLRPVSETVERIRNSEARPLIGNTNPYAVNFVELQLQGDRLRIHNQILPIEFDIDPDPELLYAIQRVRQESYRDALDILIPDVRDVVLNNPALRSTFLASESTREAVRNLGATGRLSDEEVLALYPPYMTAEFLATLELNLMLEQLGSEVAVIQRSRAMNARLPGDLPRLIVYEMFKVDDTLLQYQLTGAQLRNLYKIQTLPLVFGGLSSDGGKVRNRPIGDKEYYRVILPSSVAGRHEVRGILKSAPVRELLQTQSQGPPQRLFLRDLVLQALEQLRTRPDYANALAQLMTPQWQTRQPLWSLKLEGLQLNVSGYNAYNNSAYNEVRETRVTSPNSFTFGGRTKVIASFDTEAIALNNSVLARYEGLSVVESNGQNKFTENQDDLVLASELQLSLFELSLPQKTLQLTPYLEGIYDTEFTPTTQPDGTLNPRQSEVRGVLGLSIPAGPLLKQFKAGLALRRDFNVPNNLEAGANLKWVYEQPLATNLKWTHDLDVRYFLPSANDNATSLGLIAQWITALNVSLTDNLALRLYADAYLFQGKLPSTSALGASVILGVGLNYDRIWKPAYEGF